MKKEPYKEVPLKNSDKMAKVDACNYERVMKHEWELMEMEDGEEHCATVVEVDGQTFIWLMEELVMGVKPQRVMVEWEQEGDEPMGEDALKLINYIVMKVGECRWMNKYQKRDKIKRITQILTGKNEHPHMIDIENFDIIELLDDCNPADFSGKNKIVVGKDEFFNKK